MAHVAGSVRFDDQERRDHRDVIIARRLHEKEPFAHPPILSPLQARGG